MPGNSLFWWFLSILTAREPVLQAWSTVWAQGSVFLILETIPPRKGTSFSDHFWYFLYTVFCVFPNAMFFFDLWDFGCPKAPFRETFWITFLAEVRKQKSVFGLHRRVRIAYAAFPNWSIFHDILEDALREASGTRFFMILCDFELPGDDHLVPKSHQKMRPKKRL